MAPLWRFERHLAIERTVPPGFPVADPLAATTGPVAKGS
jgi:hypothetical protein